MRCTNQGAKSAEKRQQIIQKHNKKWQLITKKNILNKIKAPYGVAMRKGVCLFLKTDIKSTNKRA